MVEMALKNVYKKYDNAENYSVTDFNLSINKITSAFIKEENPSCLPQPPSPSKSLTTENTNFSSRRYATLRELYMQKYVEIKRDDLTLRGMLHIPNDVSQKVPIVILLHGFCAICKCKCNIPENIPI